MKSYYLILFFIIITAFILRFYNLEHIPPGIHGDEAEFGLIEQKINRGLYTDFFSLGDTGSIFGFSVLSFWTQGIFQRVFGEDVFGIRASSAFIGTTTVIFLFFLAKLFFKNIFIAFLLTLALATSHYHIAYNRMAINDIWTPFFSIAVFYFLYQGFLTKRLNNFILSGIFLGLSLYFAQSTKALPIIAFAGGTAHFFTSRLTPKRFKSNIKHLIFLFVATVLVFAPQSIYFFQHPDALTSRLDTVSVFSHLPQNIMRVITLTMSLASYFGNSLIP